MLCKRILCVGPLRLSPTFSLYTRYRSSHVSMWRWGWASPTWVGCRAVFKYLHVDLWVVRVVSATESSPGIQTDALHCVANDAHRFRVHWHQARESHEDLLAKLLQIRLNEIQLFARHYFRGDDIFPSISCPVQSFLALNIYRTNPCLKLETPVRPIQLFTREAVQLSDQLGVVEGFLSFIHARDSLGLLLQACIWCRCLLKQCMLQLYLSPLLIGVRALLFDLRSSSQSFSFSLSDCASILSGPTM